MNVTPSQVKCCRSWKFFLENRILPFWHVGSSLGNMRWHAWKFVCWRSNLPTQMQSPQLSCTLHVMSWCTCKCLHCSHQSVNSMQAISDESLALHCCTELSVTQSTQWLLLTWFLVFLEGVVGEKTAWVLIPSGEWIQIQAVSLPQNGNWQESNKCMSCLALCTPCIAWVFGGWNDNALEPLWKIRTHRFAVETLLEVLEGACVTSPLDTPVEKAAKVYPGGCLSSKICTQKQTMTGNQGDWTVEESSWFWELYHNAFAKSHSRLFFRTEMWRKHLESRFNDELTFPPTM